MPLISCRSRSNPASIMARCVLISPGAPSGLPADDFTQTILGGLESSVISFLNVMHTVLTPAFSMALAISPTDWQQSTQAGVRKTISTPSFLTRLPSSSEFFSNWPV